jgi:hypothetical protein
VTLSKTTRSDNLQLALRIMLERLGDAAVSQGYFRADEPEFSTIYSTTWSDLLARRYVSTWGSDPPFFLMTGQGWLVPEQG